MLELAFPSHYCCCLFCRNFVRFGFLSRFHAKRSFHSFCHRLQTASISGKSRVNSVANFRQQIFPINETVLTRIRRDVLLTDAYNGRVVDRKRAAYSLPKDVLQFSDLSLPAAKEQLRMLSHPELCDFVTNFALAVSSSEKVDTDSRLLQLVENVCSSASRNFSAAELLLVADALFVMRYRCTSYFLAMFREFEHRWAAMAISKKDVVQLAMSVITARKFPLSLARNVENFVESRVDEFSAGELSVVCSAFFTTNSSIRNVRMTEKIADSILRSLPANELLVYQLGSILKALRHAHFSKLSFYDRLGDCLSNSSAFFGKCLLNDLSNVAFAYASLRTSHPVLFSEISANAARLIDSQTTSVRIKDVGRLVWSFALLQEPLAETVQSQLLYLLRRDLHLMEQFSEAFIEALLGLAMWKMYPVDVLQRLFTTFPKHKHGMISK